MKQLLVVIAAAALVAGACGGGGGIDVVGGNGSGQSFCEIFESEGESVLGADVLADDLEVGQLSEIVDELVAAAPAEIKDDMATTAEVLTAVAEAVDGIDENDPEALGAMFEVIAQFEDRADEIEAAGENVEQWVIENCDVPEDFGDDSSDGFGTAEGAEARGDDPGLDALWDDCAAGDMASCDSLYLQAPIDSEYETFGSTCGNTSGGTFGSCAGGGSLFGDGAATYGDDPELDVLWDDCASGSLVSCDDLWYASPIGSEYESFGSTCGETQDQQSGGCAGFDGSGQAATYGDDPELDVLWDDCAAGDDAACDELWWNSPIDSEYEEFASLCGFRSDEPQLGDCAA